MLRSLESEISSTSELINIDSPEEALEIASLREPVPLSLPFETAYAVGNSSNVIEIGFPKASFTFSLNHPPAPSSIIK